MRRHPCAAPRMVTGARGTSPGAPRWPTPAWAGRIPWCEASPPPLPPRARPRPRDKISPFAPPSTAPAKKRGRAVCLRLGEIIGVEVAAGYRLKWPGIFAQASCGRVPTASHPPSAAAASRAPDTVSAGCGQMRGPPPALAGARWPTRVLRPVRAGGRPVWPSKPAHGGSESAKTRLSAAAGAAALCADHGGLGMVAETP